MGRLKKSCIILIMAAVMMLTACKEDSETIMREFASADKTVTIRMDESWNAQDMGVDNWIAAFTQDETEGIVVMQGIWWRIPLPYLRQKKWRSRQFPV